MIVLQLSGTENVWIDEENGTIQFWSGKTCIEYPLELALKILNFLTEHTEELLDGTR